MLARSILSIICVLALIVASVQVAGTSGHESNDTDCLACHADQISQPVSHFIEGNGDCMFCHEPDTQSAAMGTVSDDEICRLCHVANDAAVETGAHLGTSCMECHEAHSSANEHLFRTVETSLCVGACHGEHDLGVSHPIGEFVRDSNAGGAMSCVSTCHSMHQPREPKMLQMAALDLCYQCHDEKF